MNALEMVYALSVAGALLFFLAGWVARASRKTAPELPEKREGAEAALEQERHARQEAEASLQRAEFALIDAENREKEAKEAKETSERKAARADQLQTENARLAQDHERTRKELDAARERADALAKQIEELRKTPAPAASAGDVGKERELREAAEKALEEARQAKGKADNARDEAIKARDEANRARDEVARARDAAARDRDRLTRERDELQKKLTRAVDEGRAALDKARAETAAVQKTLESEKRDIEKRLAEAASATAAIDAVRAELAAEREQSARQQARITELETASSGSDEVRYENEELQVRLETASSYVVRTRKEIAQMKAELQETQGRLEAALARAARVDELERQLAAAPAADASTGSSQELEEARAQVRELRHKLQSLESKASDADRLADENARLRDSAAELDDLRDAALELDNIKGEWKHARVQVETLTRRVTELEQSRLDQMALDARLAELALVEQDAAKLRERVRFLEAMLYSAGMGAEERAPSSRQIESGTTAGDFEACLQGLIKKAASRSAVLADEGGLLVAGAGDEAPHEAMAAVSGLAGELASRSLALLPFSEVEEVHVRDASQLLFTCRLFRNQEGQFAVAALGRGAPAADDVDRTVSLVSHVMVTTGPKASSDDEPPAPDDGTPT